MNKRLGIFLILGLLVLSLSFMSAGWFSDIFGKITGNTITGNVVAATGITLSPTSATLTPGDTIKLVPTISPSTTTDTTITWTSSNTNVSTVSSDGLVTAKWGGMATITARTSNGKTASFGVTVKNYNLIMDGDFLKTSGTRIVRTGNNQHVVLRGYNLGAWLSKSWTFMNMVPTPIEQRESCVHNIEILSILNIKFGWERTKELRTLLYDNYITEKDLDMIAKTGANVVRVPFEYSLFLNEDGTYKEGGAMGFKYLDWIVEEAGKRGIYSIIDLHWAPGRQNTGGACSEVYFFENSARGVEARRRATELLKKIAQRYKDNPAVAGYEIINEPDSVSGVPSYNICNNASIMQSMGISSADCRPDRSMGDSIVLTYYGNAYNAIRSVDPNHIIFMEALCVMCWDKFRLPDPNTKGWTNVVYSTHDYFWTGTDAAGVYTYNNDIELKGEIKRKVDRSLEITRLHNIPLYIGEFGALKTDIFEYSLGLYNSYNVSYTPWTYKAAYGAKYSWGLVYYGGERVDIRTATYDKIRQVFSLDSETLMTLNEPHYNAMLNALGGRLAKSITLSRTSLSLPVGQQSTLRATVLPNNTINKNVIWTSSNPSVAIVSDGTITAISTGTAIITAKSADTFSSNINKTCSVTVTPMGSITCTSFTYSPWTDCNSLALQSRTITSQSPSGCTGGTPENLIQQCSPPCLLSNWQSTDSTCLSSNTLTRTWTKIGNCNQTIGVSKPNSETISCVYVPNIVTCTNFTYSNWSECFANGIQNRSLLTSTPVNCQAGNPILTQTCNYTAIIINQEVETNPYLEENNPNPDDSNNPNQLTDEEDLYEEVKESIDDENIIHSTKYEEKSVSLDSFFRNIFCRFFNLFREDRDC